MGDSWYGRSNGDELVRFQLIPHHETEAALLVSVTHDQPREEWIWLPKSRVHYEDDFQMGEVIDIDVPRWLCDKKGL